MIKLFQTFVTYSEDSGEELRESWVAEDTPENRAEYLDALCYSDEFADSESNFIEGKIDIMNYYYFGGGRDAPTGGLLRVSTYDELVAESKAKYVDEVKRLDKLFGGKLDD